MSVDVEDYFQVSAFEHRFERRSWGDLPCRIPQNIDRILQLFSDSNVSATFFTLGWVAERFPEVVRRISGEGHEVASHGFAHHRVGSQTSDQFREDVSYTRKLLEDTSGSPVSGYRAASFSITTDTLWAYRILQEAGYKYSSSIYPISHDHYGIPSAPQGAFRFEDGGIIEVPLSTVRLWGRNIPCAGGGYFRLLPFRFTQWALHRIQDHDGRAINFYFHPWELDTGQPRVNGIPTKSRFRHYVNLGRFEGRLKRILDEFKWDRLDMILGEHIVSTR
ncbi:MAG: DUF3473 domain-containing protein [Gammaproteobacteria bacterium]|nr:DUF3473 domain-containing protein [Gammaproteobacteria bacterium]MDH5239226.1 DUF3473 domain-containing protein [Gammaproteobacteria bacterium]MDH5259909.1 DUF3473 domain-containing protein [Gammaproteobacteria bacterium]